MISRLERSEQEKEESKCCSGGLREVDDEIVSVWAISDEGQVG
jgi:hypothetical protein